MSLFNDNDIIQRANNIVAIEWCERFVIKNDNVLSISVNRKSNPIYMIDFRAVSSSEFKLSDECVISFNNEKDGYLVNNTFVVNGFDGVEWPEFLKFHVTIGKLVLLNCPNLNKKSLPKHMFLMEYNEGEDDINDTITNIKTFY